MYYSDTGVTLFLGKPSSQQIKIYNGLKEAINQVSDAIKPGVKSSVISKLMRKCLDKSGLKRSNGHGHGIGLEPREYPMIYRGVEKN